MDTLTEHVAALDLDCLMGHIQALPRKLHDTIHDFVFTASSAIRHINANWSPPSSLHVSRLTRIWFMRSYFSKGMIFLVDRDVLAKWLNSLDRRPEIKVFMGPVRMNVPAIEVEDMSLADLRRLIDDEYLRAVAFALTARDPHFDLNYLWLCGKLQFLVSFGSKGETKWIVERDVLLARLRDLSWMENEDQQGVSWMQEVRWCALAWLRAATTERPIWDVYQELVGLEADAE